MISVYAVVALMIQAWTVAVFFQQIPAWGNFLTVPEIVAIFAYRIAESFLECILLVGLLLLISFILPASYFRNVFKIRGTMFAVSLIGLVMLFWKRFGSDPGVVMADYVQIWTVGTLVTSALISGLSTRLKGVPDFAEWIADQSIIFLYILIPLSIISCIIVLLRNAL